MRNPVLRAPIAMHRETVRTAAISAAAAAAGTGIALLAHPFLPPLAGAPLAAALAAAGYAIARAPRATPACATSGTPRDGECSPGAGPCTTREDLLARSFAALEAHSAVVDARGVIVAVNDAWRAYNRQNDGTESTSAVGVNCLEICDRAGPSYPEAGQVARAIRAALAGSDEPVSVEYPCHAPDARRWYRCTVRGFAAGQDRFALVTHFDISGPRLAGEALAARNAELTRARADAEAADRAKSAFLANMSHEIRTPLTAILGFAEQLAEEGDLARAPRHRVDAIDTIRTAGRHLLEVINDILDLSRIEANQLTPELIPYAVRQLLLDVETAVAPRAASRAVSLHTHIAADVPATAMLDPTRVRQVLLNLVGNAAKFTAHGRITVTATLAPGQPPMLLVDVEDTGPGIAPVHLERLFRPFSQADASVTRAHGGSGLGLVISRRIARLMGGDVTLEWTMPGQGSRFRLSLPLPPAPAPEPGTPRSPALPAGEGPRHATLAGRILLAEDGEDNQRLIAFHLRKAGAHVDIAANGRIALDMLDRAAALGHPYHMLLTDMQMPEMDGYMLARTLREHGCVLPIIAVTAHALVGDAQRCLEAGCDDYASKPIDRNALLQVCARWLGPPRTPSATLPV